MSTRDKALRLMFLDAGRGDAILIEFPDGSMGIVDGNWESTTSDSLPLAYRNLRDGEYSIRFLCLSHPHSDHFTGLYLILRELGKKVEEFWHSGGEYFKHSLHHRVEVADSKRAFEKAVGDLMRLYQVRDELMERGLRSRNVHEGSTLGCFGGVRVSAIGPGESEWRRYLCEIGKYRAGTRSGEADHNLISGVLCLEYGESLVLLTADAPRTLLEWHALGPLPGNAVRPKYAVLKIPHHGSSHNHCVEFCSECVARDSDVVAVICGRDRYDMEQRYPSVLSDLTSAGVKKVLYAGGSDRPDSGLENISTEVVSVLATETERCRQPTGSISVIVELSQDGTVSTSTPDA